MRRLRRCSPRAPSPTGARSGRGPTCARAAGRGGPPPGAVSRRPAVRSRTSFKVSFIFITTVPRRRLPTPGGQDGTDEVLRDVGRDGGVNSHAGLLAEAHRLPVGRQVGDAVRALAQVPL